LDKETPNVEVLREYKEKYDDYMQKAADLADITKQRENAKDFCDALSKQRLDRFMAGFTTISQKLKEMYQVSIRFL
jgi:structural maintenance of chromosome 4